MNDRVSTDKLRKRAFLIRTFLLLLLLIAWELTSKQGTMTFRYTSSPTAILLDGYDFILSGAFFKHATVTLKEAFLGLFFGSVIGIGMAILLSQWKLLGMIIKPVIHAINSIPQLTLAPVYILWFGIGLRSKVFLAGLLVFFQLFFATYNAIIELDPHLIEAASLLGAKRGTIVRRIVLPTCTPWIIVGLRNGVASALVGAIIGEYMGAAAGFGWMIAYATSYFNITRVMTCVLLLLLTGVALNGALNFLENQLLRWKPAFARPAKSQRKGLQHEETIQNA